MIRWRRHEKNKKRALSAIGAILLSVNADVEASKGGITFPTQNEPAWYATGPMLEKYLKKLGYDPVLYYGGDGDVPIQQRHIERKVKKIASNP